MKYTSMITTKKFAILLAVTGLAVTVPSFTNAQVMVQAVNTASSAIALDMSAPGVASISWPTIDAKSAFIYNPISNQIVYEKNADMQRPTASLLKIMTAATAENILALSPVLAKKPLTVPDMKNETPADYALPTGSTWLPDHLIQIMLLGSSNKAAETLASQLVPRSSFLSLMNYKAKQMDLKQTYFRNPSGLTETLNTTILPEGQLNAAGGVSTAREIAKMMWAVIAQNPGLLDITRQESLTINVAKSASNSKGTTIIANTDKILKDFPIVFGKTGFTQNAGGNLAVVMQKSETSHPYVIVVLGSSIDKRFEDVAKLASTTLKLIDLQNITTAVR